MFDFHVLRKIEIDSQTPNTIVVDLVFMTWSNISVDE